MSVNLPLDSTRSANLCADYAPLEGVFDELMGADFTVRPHWRSFISALEAIPAADLATRWRQAERLRHENGLTFTIEPDEDGSSRPWDLDFVPLVLDPADWRSLERGLSQRARLLNAILADLNGPQRLLREGDLPGALLFANPHFLRPCRNLPAKDGVYLHNYAADMGRGPDGRWWVLADRTQAPSGLGYALENRIVLARCLPELFRDHHIERLAGFFQSAHESLVARTGRESPRIVLLTAGSDTTGYFAHAYIARYLGYSLAEGPDLTVRDNRVYLKTVDGLKPVDLIIRRVDDQDCDPLELRGGSSLGVAGLLQAARAQTVTIANALGSGVVETKALMPFLPQLCRKLFGEELILPSLATWWCGQRDALDHVLANLDDLACEPAFDRRPILTSGGVLVTSALSAEERDQLRRQLAVRGEYFVAHEVASSSTTPAWIDGKLQPRPMMLRVFAAADSGGAGDYTIMPGGLARISSSNDLRTVSLQKGESTKDICVLAEGPVAPITLLRSPFSYIEPKRTGKDLPSRAADNLFWLGRYAERSEDIIRVLRSVIRHLAEDDAPVDSLTAMERVVQVLLEKGKSGEAAPGGARSDRRAEQRPERPEQLIEQRIEKRLAALMFDAELPYGLQETLAHLRRTTSLTRDRLSIDAWRTLQTFQADMAEHAQHGHWLGDFLDAGTALEMLDGAVRALGAFSGMEMENMTRNHGWRFLDMGRRLERAKHHAGLMRTLLVAGDPQEDGGLVLLLELADSLMTYRSRYLTTPILPPVIDLLLLDETNPRSIAFQIAALSSHVDELPRDADRVVRSDQQRLILSLLTELRLCDIVALCETTASGRRRALDAVFASILTKLPKLSELISRDYFSHAEARRPAEL
ncbi:MAG: circularly permuted type 2 ATP-grasp protein [Rhodospirillales bacterium]|nr:circularly permuted type 2 ATP-grasp protein [Rhodospirillales bacterium]